MMMMTMMVKKPDLTFDQVGPLAVAVYASGWGGYRYILQIKIFMNN